MPNSTLQLLFSKIKKTDAVLNGGDKARVWDEREDSGVNCCVTTHINLPTDLDVQNILWYRVSERWIILALRMGNLLTKGKAQPQPKNGKIKKRRRFKGLFERHNKVRNNSFYFLSFNGIYNFLVDQSDTQYSEEKLWINLVMSFTPNRNWYNLKLLLTCLLMIVSKKLLTLQNIFEFLRACGSAGFAKTFL